MGLYDHETTDQRGAALDLYATIYRGLLEMARVLDQAADEIYARSEQLGGGAE